MQQSRLVLTLSTLPLAIAGIVGSTVTPNAYGQANVLEEVVVTANRREESLQSVAMAVSAFSEDMMRDQGIVDLKGITERTPGFSMGVFNPGQPQLYIRGIGSNEDGAGGDQSVIVFIDEVYIGRSAGMDVDLFDLERVEVLRGPQGTLFGKNVVGGAVNMITKKPGEETELAIEGSFGSYDAQTLRGLVSGQLTEGVFGKLSFSSRSRDGYFESQIGKYAEFFPDGTNAPDTHDIDSNSVRAGLRFLPSDDVEINLTASYSEIDKLGQPDHAVSPDNPPVGFSYTAQAALIPNYDDEIHKGIFDDPGYFDSTSSSFTARVDWQFNDAVQFTSLTALRNVEANNSDIISDRVSDNGINRLYASVLPLGTTILYGSNFYEEESDAFTQELRLTSTDTGPLQWVSGLYYMKEDTRRKESIGVGIDLLAAPNTLINLVPYLPGYDDQDNETRSSAVFGQFSYDLTDKLTLTAGARYTTEEKDITRTGVGDPLNIVGTFNVDTGEDWSETTKKLSLEYQSTDDLFWYFTYSEGFKSGGFQGMAAGELAASTPFDPENAELFEGGIKSEWLDNRLRLNLAVFSTDYQDLQILQLLVPEDAPEDTPGVLVTQNASDAKVKGIELEFTAFPIDGMTVQGSVTKLDTEYQNFGIPSGYRTPVAGAEPERDGNELRNAPDIAWNLLLRYDWELASGAGLAAQFDWRHKDLVWQDPDNFNVAAVPEYDVGDLRFIYTTSNGNTQLSAWVTNITDEEYFLHNYPVSNTGAATPAPPRMYGVTVSWRNQ